MRLSVYVCLCSTLTTSSTPTATTAILTAIKPQDEKQFPWQQYLCFTLCRKIISRFLRPSSNFIERQVPCSAVLRSAHKVYLCVLCGSQNKQRLFPYTALTDWFLQQRWSVFTERYGLNLRVMYIKRSKPSGHYMYHQFNIQQFYVLPTERISVFCVDLRTNSDYFPKQY